MNISMMQALLGIAYACGKGDANRHSAYALGIIADSLISDPDLREQRAVILDVADPLIFDGEPMDGDGDRLLAAARTIALVTEQRNEDLYVWEDTKCS